MHSMANNYLFKDIELPRVSADVGSISRFEAMWRTRDLGMV